MVKGLSGDAAVAGIWVAAVGLLAALVGVVALAGAGGSDGTDRAPHRTNLVLVVAASLVLAALGLVEVWVGSSSSLFDRHELLTLSGVLAVALTVVAAVLVWRTRRTGRRGTGRLLVGLCAFAAVSAWLTWLLVPFHTRVDASLDDMTADARQLQGANATATHHQIGTFDTVAVEPAWFCRDGLGFVLDPSGTGSALWWCPTAGLRRSVAPPHLEALGDGWYLEREATT